MSAPAPRRSREEILAEDAEARILAQTCFDRPLVLEAGAGTGKTTALVARVVAWALGEGWERSAVHLGVGEAPARRETERVAARVLQRMVAITFTEAAAAEMAQRVGVAFSKIAAGIAPDELEASEGIASSALPRDAETRSRRARSLASALDRLGVRTIHAYARRLLASYPVEAGLHPAFEVDPDGRAAAEVVRELLEAKLREAYADPGDPVLLGLAARGVTAPELETELRGLLQSATPPNLLAEDPFDAARVDALRREILAGLERLCEWGSGAAAGRGRTKAATELIAGATEACDRLRTMAGGGVPGFEALQETVRGTVGPRLGRLEEWANGILTSSEQHALGASAVTALPKLAAILHPRLDHLCALDAPTLDLARRALLPLLAEAEEALRARGIVSYDGLLRGAAQLLERNPDVAARERAQIDQLLVDEFQDTDRLQCAMIEQLALAGDARERPGLFLVGDPKQSIFGWRGADLDAYDAFVDQVQAAGGAVRRLSVNRRSVQPVLDEVERVIRPWMHQERGVQPSFQPLLAHRSDSGFAESGRRPVEYWVSRAAEPPARGTRKSEATAIEARALARDVSGLIRECGVAPSTIGVLLRSFGDVEEVLSALREAGVPVAVARDRSYYRRREVVDALCLVRCVLDPSDTLALVGFLRSSVVGVPDAALLPLWSQKLPALVARVPEGGERTLGEIRSAVAAAAAALPPGVPGIEVAAGWEAALVFALEALSGLRESFESDPSNVFVERLRSFLLFEASEAARPLGAFRLANLERFFREVGGALADGADPAELLRHLRQCVRERRETQEARPLDAAEQAVQVMSIHGAKGLGFEHTYVMQLHKETLGRGPKRLPPRAVRWREYAELRLLGEKTPGFLQVEALEARTAAAEHIRLLYVAMTRAKKRLVLAGLWPEADSKARTGASHVALLAGREEAAPALDSAMAELRADRTGDRIESQGACWVFPALGENAVPEGAAEGDEVREAEGAAARAAIAAADAVRIAEVRASALARMERSFGGPVTRDSHEWIADLAGARSEAEPSPSRGARPAAGDAFDTVASAVGTAVHRALELLDPVNGPDDALRALYETADRALGESGLGGEPLGEARARTRDLAERFVAGDLFRRFEQIAPHVLARELPVLLPPDASDAGPAGYVAGRIDLVYADPETGEPVVADYKTGRAEGDDEIQAASERHAAQGAVYARALRDALGLPRPPRFELWFLHAGRIATVR